MACMRDDDVSLAWSTSFITFMLCTLDACVNCARTTHCPLPCVWNDWPLSTLCEDLRDVASEMNEFNGPKLDGRGGGDSPPRVKEEHDCNDDVETHQYHALQPVRFAVLHYVVHGQDCEEEGLSKWSPIRSLNKNRHVGREDVQQTRRGQRA